MTGIILGIILVLMLCIIMAIIYSVIFFAVDFLKTTKNVPSLESILPKELLDQIARDAKDVKEEKGEDDKELEDDDSYAYYS